MKRTHNGKRYRDFKKPIYCPRASTIGYDRYVVVAGDLIKFEVDMGDALRLGWLGRVLGIAECDGMGKDYDGVVLVVLTASADLSFGHEYHVPIDHVLQVFSPGDFTRWFLFGDMPKDLTEVLRAAEYGSLSNSYIDKYLDNGKLIFDETRAQKKASTS
jgi:hypothetical protein